MPFKPTTTISRWDKMILFMRKESIVDSYSSIIKGKISLFTFKLFKKNCTTLKKFAKFKEIAFALGLFLILVIPFKSAMACTRTLYVSNDGKTVITGRNMDWVEDMGTNLKVLPAGQQRDGGMENSNNIPFTWVSRYGSIIADAYDLEGVADGMNEKGLVANLLYLAESDYGVLDPSKPTISIYNWAEYVLDNFATVSEAVNALKKEPFQIFAPVLPNGKESSLHLSLSDASGDSAIFEYIDGKLVIHHGKQYKVMTNSPSYDQQIALNTYWKNIGGLAFLPGTNKAADRFARASFLLDAIPKEIDKNYIAAVPGQSFVNQAIACVTGLQRSVSVPLGITTPEKPEISSTIWRTISDQKNLNYYYDSATSPNTFWVSLKKFNLKSGAPTKKLSLKNGRILSGEVSSLFVEEKPSTK